MAVRKLRESNNLSKLEICNILVDYGFGNEEEGYLDYFLDNPKYCAGVNLDDMGSYVDDYDKGDHIELPYANGATRKILRTREDVDEFLDFIDELNYRDNFTESSTRKTRGKIVTESADGMPEPEIVKDRGAKIYNETIKILDRFGSKYVSASMYAYALKEKKLADKTLYQLAKDTYAASSKLETYGMFHRHDYE